MSSPLDQNEMQSQICHDHHDTRNDTQIANISPHGSIVEAKGGEDCSAGDINVDPVFVFEQFDVSHLIYEKSFQAIMENR